MKTFRANRSAFNDTVYRLGQSMVRFLLTFSKITTIFYLLSRISQINTLHCDASQYFTPWFSHKKDFGSRKLSLNNQITTKKFSFNYT